MIHFPIIEQFCCGFCSVRLVSTMKHLYSLFSRANHWCNRVIHESKFPPSFAESWVCGRADVSIQLHGNLCDEQVELQSLFDVLVSARPRLVLLQTPQEEEQLQPAKHKQPGAQHHTDKREACCQQVVCMFCLFVSFYISVCLYTNNRFCVWTLLLLVVLL